MSSELQEILSRVKRVINRVHKKEGVIFQQSHVLDDGIEHTFTVTGVKSPLELEDDLLELFIWVWSIKDYLKEFYKANNRDPNIIEKLVDDSETLQYISDIANRAKHANLRKSRSNKFAILVDVGIEVPQTAISKIIFGAFSVHTDVSKSSEVRLKAFIKIPNSEEKMDAFAILNAGIQIWEQAV
ncbi:MAG: hypothetical protein PHQ03_07200 [Methylococcales bacterium]|nr:hypothetical protein [Methylococcales bacterium]